MTRSLEWAGCVNVRDLGGVPLAGGGETRYGVLVRADNVRNLDDEGWDALAEHGITRIVDLRWPEELAEDPPRDVDIDVVHVSLLGTLDPEYDSQIEQYMAKDDPGGFWSRQYLEFLERYRAEFGRAVGAIADAPGPALFHCAGGKDRTGLIAALLLRLAGAEIDDIAADYSLSGPNLHRRPNPWVESAPTEAERGRRLFMGRTPPEAMARTLEQLGDVEEYLRSAGVTDDQLARLKERLAAA